MKRWLKVTLLTALSIAVMFTFIPAFAATASAATKAKTVKITVAAKEVNVGYTLQAKAKVTPAKANKKVKWKSSDKSIATVDKKGVITGVGEGTVKITAVSKSNKKAKASVKITVVETLTAAQRDTINSLRLVDTSYEGRLLYEMNYTADTKVDEVLSSEVSAAIKDAQAAGYEAGTSVVAAGNLVIGDLLGLNAGELEAQDAEQFGCSAFTIHKNEKGDDGLIMARNYDMVTDLGVIVHTKKNPADTGVLYDSVGIADPYTMLDITALGEEGKLDLNTPEAKERLLLAPYALMDGVNEKGFTVGVFQLDQQPTNQQTEKPELHSLNLIKVLLDKAATVDEAIEVLNDYDVYCGGYLGGDYNVDMHFIMADATGKSAIVEYVNDKMYVTNGGSADPSKNDPILDLSGLNINNKGVNDYWYLDSIYGMQLTDDYGAISKNVDLSERRVHQDFQVVSNTYLANVDGVEAIQVYAGDGVDRYNTHYSHLNGKHAISKKYAMNCLKQGMYRNTDGDTYLFEDYLTDPDTAALYWEYYNVPEIQKYFLYEYGIEVDSPDAVHQLLSYIAASDYEGWITAWSTVYDTSEKNIEVCFGEDYSKKFYIELPCYE